MLLQIFLNLIVGFGFSSESAGFLLGFFTALIGSSSIPTEKCEVCTCAIYHGPQIIEAEGPLGVDIYNFIKASAKL